MAIMKGYSLIPYTGSSTEPRNPGIVLCFFGIGLIVYGLFYDHFEKIFNNDPNDEDRRNKS